MALIEEALKTLITTGPAFVTLAGLAVYPGHIPQDARLPAVAYQVVTSEPNPTHDGASKLITRHVQFTIDAKSYADNKAVAAALRARLDGYRGTIDGCRIGALLWENEYDSYAEASLLENIRQDYLVIYTQV